MYGTGTHICLDGFTNAIVGRTAVGETSGFGVKTGHSYADLEEDGFDGRDSTPAVVSKKLMDISQTMQIKR